MSRGRSKGGDNLRRSRHVSGADMAIAGEETMRIAERMMPSRTDRRYRQEERDRLARERITLPTLSLTRRSDDD